jgi:putative ABC transport system substrate-binding protein
VRRIGILTSGDAQPPDAAPFAAFRDGMNREGFSEDGDYAVIYRFGVSDAARTFQFAKELVRMNVDVIVTSSTAPTQAARAATSVTPIVMVASHDPVEAGVVASLAAPGGNVTGQSLSGGVLMPLQLDVLEQVTSLRRVLYLSPIFPSPAPGYASVTEIFRDLFLQAASARGIDVLDPVVRTTHDVKSILAGIQNERLDAIYLIESPTWFSAGTSVPIDEVVDFATRQRLVSISGMRMYADRGLLASYGDGRSTAALWRGAAHYVARILRGARPASLPVEGPTAYELIINAKTAAAIGREIPQQLLARAAVVIH